MKKKTSLETESPTDTTSQTNKSIQLDNQSSNQQKQTTLILSQSNNNNNSFQNVSITLTPQSSKEMRSSLKKKSFHKSKQANVNEDSDCNLYGEEKITTI